MNASIILGALIGLSLTSCFKAANQGLGSTQKLIRTYKTYAVTTTSTEGGGVSAAFDANSSGNQLMQAAEDSTIKEAAVVFPPGALAINTSIRMEEAAPIASAALTSEIGIDTQVTQTAAAVAIVPEKPMDAKAPFVLRIPIPVSTGLMLDDPYSKLVVMFRVNMVTEGKTVNGIIPRSEISIQNGVAEIQSLYFGSFQAAFTSVAVTDKVLAETKAEIITKAESAARPPLQITGRMPFVTKADGTVEIHGMNFRPTMIVALGGKKVSGLKVESDSKASFIAPGNAGFGLADVTVEQEGVTQTVSVFYSGTKNDFPIMMKTEAEVCKGEKFYDATGLLKTGTRICDSVVACAKDGQTNCLATTDFPSTQKATLAAKVISGQTVAGVQGTGSSAPAQCAADGATGCVANVDFPAAEKQGLNAKVVSGHTVAGVAGQLMPRPADCSTDGASACVVDGSAYRAAKLSNFNASQISSGVQIAGITGSMAGVPAQCSSDGQENCVANSGFPAVDKISVLTNNIAKIRSSLTIAGVTGALGDCSSDGASGCVVVGPSYASMLKTGAETKILSGNTLGGINGTAPGRPADCSSDGTPGCVTTSTVTSMVVAGAEPKIVQGQNIGGIFGTTPARPTNCSTNGGIECVATVSYPSVNISLLSPSDIRAGKSVAGITGNLLSCAGEGETGCIAVGPTFAAMETTSAAAKILSGQSVGGVAGTAQGKPADCAVDGAVGCVSTSGFPAANASGASGKIVLGQSVAGIAGTASGTRPSDCSSDGETGCVAATNYPAMDKLSAAAKIAAGVNLGGVTGTASVRPPDCAMDNETSCVATSIFPAVDKTSLTSNSNKIASSMTIAGVAGTLANCSADGAQGCITVASYPAMMSSGAMSKIISGQVLGGVSGSAPVAPANCTTDGQTACVATTPFPALNKANLTSNVSKFSSTLTIAGVAGALMNCSADGGTNCIASGAYPSVSTSGLAAKVANGYTVAGVAGTVPAKYPDCASDGQVSCSTVSSFPAVDKVTLQGNLAFIKSGTGVAGLNGTMPNCAADNATGCVTSTAYPSVIKANVTPAVVKKSIVIAGVSGDYPSSMNPLADATVTPDLDSATFNSKMRSPSSFEYFDSAGNHYLASGNPDIVGTNFKAPFVIFGESGTISDCAADGAVGCVTTSAFKSADMASFTPWDIRKGKTIAGVVGNIFFSANGAVLSVFNRTTGDDANTSTSVADFYDTIEDYNVNGTMPSAPIPGSIVGIPGHFERSALSDSNSDGTCDGAEQCVYKDKMTNLLWAKVAPAPGDFESAITYCKTSNYGGYATGWRLPTQKELMAAYINGIWSIKTPLGLSSSSLFSATTQSTALTSAMTFSMASGMGASAPKTSSIAYLCVHQ